VLDSVHWLGEHENAEPEWLPVDGTGRLSPEVLEAAIARDPASVALVSVMWANNEVGTVQPITELAQVASKFRVPFHSDAVQAAGQLGVDLAASGATALTVTGHKIGGPVGAGALLLTRGTESEPVLHGGGQERDVRSGTLDAAAIAGFATAVEVATTNRPDTSARLARLRDELVTVIRAAVPDAVLNGADPGPGRLPGNAHFSFPGCEGDALLLLLDSKGIACSTGSACTAGVAQPSHVLLAMGADEPRARGSLRFSFGHDSTEADVAAVAAVIGEVVERARRAGRV
jgi:cysteine desulfurase